MTSISNFITDSGQSYGTTVLGTRKAVVSDPSLHDVSTRYFKVVEIDFSVNIEGEFTRWVLWVGDSSISSANFNNPDTVANSDYMCFPLAGGIVHDSTLYRTIKPSNLWINNEQRIVLCSDPTLGVGFYSLSIHGIYLRSA